MANIRIVEGSPLTIWVDGEKHVYAANADPRNTVLVFGDEQKTQYFAVAKQHGNVELEKGPKAAAEEAEN